MDERQDTLRMLREGGRKVQRDDGNATQRRFDFDAPRGQNGQSVREQDRRRLHDQAFGESGEGLHERELRERYGIHW